MDNKEFTQCAAEIESYAIAISGLTDIMNEDLGFTFHGAIEEYEQRIQCNEKEAAFWWMNDNYSRLSAMVYACGCIATSMKEQAARLTGQSHSS